MWSAGVVGAVRGAHGRGPSVWVYVILRLAAALLPLAFAIRLTGEFPLCPSCCLLMTQLPFHRCLRLSCIRQVFVTLDKSLSYCQEAALLFPLMLMTHFSPGRPPSTWQNPWPSGHFWLKFCCSVKPDINSSLHAAALSPAQV